MYIYIHNIHNRLLPQILTHSPLSPCALCVCPSLYVWSVCVCVMSECVSMCLRESVSLST